MYKYKYNHKIKYFKEDYSQSTFYKHPIAINTVTDEQWKNRGESANRIHSIMSSLIRTKSTIKDIALANVWEYFVTFTFDSKNGTVDRKNYDLVSKKLSKWLDHLRQRKAKNLKYLIIPEQHKDGAYHFHGLLSNIGTLDLTFSGVYQKGYKVYNIKSFTHGFTNVTIVKDTKKVSNYVLKYITKSLVENTFNKKRYWVSKNINRPIVIKRYEYDLLGQIEYSVINASHAVQYSKTIGDLEINNITITTHNDQSNLIGLSTRLLPYRN